MIERKREEAFLTAFEQVKAFAGISADENAIDYLLGAYFLFPACKQSQITTGLPLPTGVYKFEEDCKHYYKLLLSLIAMIQFDMNSRSQTISISTLSENFGSTVPIDFHCSNFRPCITAYTWSKSQRYPFLRLRI